MPSFARREIVAGGEVGLYHCVSRCVRRAFLCGRDPLSGKNYDYRKQWIRDRLRELSEIFALDVCGYAVMSNHLHAVLRTRPDVSEQWSDEEVARRWWRLFPKRRNEDDSPAEPTAMELQMLMADEKALKERRERLGSLSWFMRCLNEPIARRANKEDRCTGRFWEGRFKSQALLDESAVLACMVYVDLNPIRAGIAKTPETSEFTSAHDRIVARQATEEQTGERQPRRSRSRTPASDSEIASRASRDAWLAPIELPTTDAPPSTPAEPLVSQKPATVGARQKTSASKSRRKGVLRMTQEDYLRLLDWTGRQIRRDKRGAIPNDLAPILARLQVTEETWLDAITHFGRWFHRAAGRADRLREAAERSGNRWFQGITRSRQLFA